MQANLFLGGGNGRMAKTTDRPTKLHLEDVRDQIAKTLVPQIRTSGFRTQTWTVGAVVCVGSGLLARLRDGVVIGGTALSISRAV